MNRPLHAFLPDRISVQIALLIVLSLAAIHLFVTALFFWSRNEIERRPPPGPASEIAGAVRLLASVPQSERSQLLQYVRLAFPRVDIAPGGEVASGTDYGDPRVDFLRRDLGPQFQVVAHSTNPSDARNDRIVIRLADGGVLSARLPLDRPPRFFGGPFFMTLMFILVSVTLLALWAGRALIDPLRRFVSAAESFSPDVSGTPVPEQGPFEIRAAAKALNRMTHRIRGLIEDRTRMLAAMGHDLRTPITRMRLRSEFIPDLGLRNHMLHDLDQMRGMIDAALTYLREGHSREEKTDLDIAILLQTVCEEFSDLGGNVRYEGPAQLTIRGRPNDLQRAIGNLVDNALRYAGHATVRLMSSPPVTRIEIEDDGPGIPQADKARMLEPFIRGDDARGMNEASGFGLGLSIANSMILAHNGRLTLIDRQPQGLLVRIELEGA
jgi:signal transduction histidine kinase